MAHRLGSQDAFENTASAGLLASEYGADVLEMDLAITKDGIPIITHDTDLERLTGVKGKVSDYNYDDLPELINQYEIQFSPGTIYYRAPGDPIKFSKFEDFLNLLNNADTDKLKWINI